MKKKNWGWVVQNKLTGKFAGEHEACFGGECQEIHLKKAYNYLTREYARDVKWDSETVLKVSLTKTYEPKKIIGRG